MKRSNLHSKANPVETAPRAAGKTSTPAKAQAMGQKNQAKNGAPPTPSSPKQSSRVRLPKLTRHEKWALMCAVDLERRQRQARTLWRLCRHLSSSVPSAELLKMVPRMVVHVLDAEAASLQLHDAQRDALVFYAVEDAAAPDLVGHVIPLTHGIGARAFHSGQASVTYNVQQSPDYNSSVEEKTGRRIESLLTVPIANRDGTRAGILQVLTGLGEYWDYDLEFLQVIATVSASLLAPESDQLPPQIGTTQCSNSDGGLPPRQRRMNYFQAMRLVILAVVAARQSKTKVDHLNADDPDLHPGINVPMLPRPIQIIPEIPLLEGNA